LGVVERRGLSYHRVVEGFASVALRWLGRGLILLAIYVALSSLFFPEGVQPLSDVVCPAGTELDNGAYALAGRPDEPKLEVVCTSPSYTESAGADVALVVASLVAVGLGALFLSGRMPRMAHRSAGTQFS
jgi:uncharacterized membrane protein YphA (DoxX/SURF4 family)